MYQRDNSKSEVDEDGQESSNAEKEPRFQWLKDCYQLEEEDIVKYAGQDVAVYLIYLKYSMILFWAIFLFCGLPLIITYYSLSIDEEKFDIFQQISIKSYQVKGQEVYWGVTFEIFVIYVVIVAFVHAKLYFYE